MPHRPEHPSRVHIPGEAYAKLRDQGAVMDSHDPYHERYGKMSLETLEPEAMDPKLLTEIERQDAVLAELPEDYEFPLFDAR